MNYCRNNLPSFPFFPLVYAAAVYRIRLLPFLPEHSPKKRLLILTIKRVQPDKHLMFGDDFKFKFQDR